ncbi:bola-like protein [Lipomyces orientalis]|uniref:Bola-like protein n=1 Tax=Lipomyces orientalis TaxID=1233043 RepID=A0ACC3TUI6_9ASCO
MFSATRLLIRSRPYRPLSILLSPAPPASSQCPTIFTASISRNNMSTEAPTAPEVPPDTGHSQTPYEDKIRSALTQSLKPTYLKIYNDSHKHAHHAAMRDSVSKETHFRLEIVSEAFEGKRLPMRHRLIYQMFSKEMNAEGGIHAMQLLTLTPKEWNDRQAKSNLE